MKSFKLLTLIFACTLFANLRAQISTNELPYSFMEENKYLIQQNKNAIEVYNILLPKTVQELEKEDIEFDSDGVPPRFGYPIPVQYTMENSGTWRILENGDKLWQMTIYSPGALSINLLYNKFWLPEGSRLYIYSDDLKYHMGAFTSANNKGDSINIKGFATGLTYGDKITLEYYQPSSINQSAVISIGYVVHGYRYIDIPNISSKSFGGSGNCQVNVNCSEGNNWQQEKKAVALILVDGYRYCTGSLINTTANDGRPLFLTADHCLGGWANDPLKYDAITNSDLTHFSFYWNYESPSCDRGGSEPMILSTSGATVIANNSFSDFALLHLTEDPELLQEYDTII